LGLGRKNMIELGNIEESQAFQMFGEVESNYIHFLQFSCQRIYSGLMLNE
jgi:hypothetical protein